MLVKILPESKELYGQAFLKRGRGEGKAWVKVLLWFSWEEMGMARQAAGTGWFK